MSKASKLLRLQRTPGNIFAQAQIAHLAAVEQRDAEVEVGSLDELSTDVGMFNNMLNIRGDVTINQSTSPATFTGSGVVDCWPAIEIFAGVYAVWFCLNSGVVTYYINSADGKVYAGAGAVVQDEDGLALQAVSVYGDKNKVKWITIDGALIAAEMWGAINSTAPDRDGNYFTVVRAEPGGVGAAQWTAPTPPGSALTTVK